MQKKAIYPGSFDPITYGHIDIIKRSLKFLDKLIVGIGTNSKKSSLFSYQEKYQMINHVLEYGLTPEEYKKITISYFEGLLVEFAQKNSVNLIIRGIRVFSDFEYEFNLANINLKLMSEIETIFLPTIESSQHISSTLLKDVISLNGDASSFAPEYVIKAVEAKLTQ